jgi:hypothetical protein
VKSSVASLRQLTLPFGATSGQRIELDGVNGEIRIYDSDNNLLILISPEGILIYDEAGDVRMEQAIPGDLRSQLSLYTRRTDETRGGLLSLDDSSDRNRLVLTPGENDEHGGMDLALFSESADGTRRGLLQAVAFPYIGSNSVLRPMIDLTGASAPAGYEPNTIVYDIHYGTPDVLGNSPNLIRTYGRGIIAYGEKTTNSLISTTNNVYSEICTTGDAPVLAGRRYRITMTSAFNMLTGGSGFAPGDYWFGKFQRSTDSGSNWADIWGPGVVARHGGTVAARVPIPLQYVYYDPSADAATVRWRFLMAKGSGATTVTSTVEATAACPTQLAAEDVGEAIAP